MGEGSCENTSEPVEKRRTGCGDCSNIPSLPKEKVVISRVVHPEHALRLLQRLYPDMRTSYWRILGVGKPLNEYGSQSNVRQIISLKQTTFSTQSSLRWFVGSVFLRLKNRHSADGNKNTLEKG